MDSDEACLNSENINQRHRQERKELQSKITALKKTVTKNDKKKKKEIADQISQLEQDLEEKQQQELNAMTINLQNANGDQDEQADVPDIKRDAEIIPIDSESEIRMTRAQRRRNRKENDDKERNKRIIEQEKVNKHGPRILELNAINEALKNMGLQIYNVPADGNCLFCAIQHQLEITSREAMEIDELRQLTAEFMRDNKDDFLPFMYSDSDDSASTEEQFEKYCNDVALTKLWGSQLELRALSNLLKCPIKVIQASGPATLQGEQFEGVPLILTYHRHLYRLGEHYNSTITATTEENDE